MNITFAELEDLEGWMSLVTQVRDSFPGLETAAAMEEHKNTVAEFIDRRSAICAEIEHEIVGGLLFSKEESMLCFLAVSPKHRRRHIAEQMVRGMLEQLDDKRDVVVSTYCKGVPEGAAARAFYRRIGFTEGEIAEEFGSPVQIFTLKR